MAKSRKLRRAQSITLFVIWEHLASGGFPTARQLSERFDLSETAARMRIYRLRAMGYLRSTGTTLTIDGNVVIDQPETAALVLRIRETCEGASGQKVKRTRIVTIARTEFRFARGHAPSVIQHLVRLGYLSEVDAWPEHLKVGPQIPAELEYLERLAARFET